MEGPEAKAVKALKAEVGQGQHQGIGNPHSDSYSDTDIRLEGIHASSDGFLEVL